MWGVGWCGVWWADVTILRYEGMMYEMHWVDFPERVWGGFMRWGKAERVLGIGLHGV